MNRKISLGKAIALMCIICAVTITITMVCSRRMFNKKVHYVNEMEAMYNKISEIDRVVRKNYIGNIDENILMDNIANGFVVGIGDDKNGKYINAKKYKELRDIEEGKIVGIGARTERDITGYMKVVSVYDNSADMQGKIQRGDLIIKIDDTDVSSENYDDCESKLNGEPGTSVSLVVRRGNEDILIDIIRSYVEIHMLTYKIYDSIGYIKIVGFNDATVSQFNKAIRELLKSKVSGIIFDVRDNPGGTINSVCAILEPLLPKEGIVMITMKDGTKKEMSYKGTDKIKIPMVTIINEKSASAAELFAQVLKDYERSKIVGVNSFGKGTVQHIFELKDGSAIDLTFAKFQTFKSPNFDGVGVKPDFEVKLTSEQLENFELLDENTDSQLKKSIELLQTSVS